MLKGMEEGKKTVPFNFDESLCLTFRQLKACFTTAPVLAHFDPNLPIMIETDASGFAIGAVLSQQRQRVNKDSMAYWYPVAFYSWKMIIAETRYETHDGE